MNDLLDFYLRIYDKKVLFGDFNLEPTNPVMINFMDNQNFTNLIKNKTCFKGVGSCIDLILTTILILHLMKPELVIIII